MRVAFPNNAISLTPAAEGRVGRGVLKRVTAFCGDLVLSRLRIARNRAASASTDVFSKAY